MLYNTTMEKSYLRKLCLSGIMIAIGYIVTAFLGIPYASGAGYLNFGDVITLVSSVILGPWYGAFIGVVFSSMADLTSGFVMFIPFTIVAKALMAITAGLLYRVFPKKIKFLSFLIGTLLMVLIYFISYMVYFGIGAYVSTLFDLIQAVVATVLGYIVIAVLERVIPKLQKGLKIDE